MVSEKNVIKKNANNNLDAKVLWETGWSYIRDIIDTAREPFLILNDKLIVTAANECFYNFFKVSKKETEGKLIYKLGNGQWDVDWLRNLLEKIIPKNQSFNDFEVDHIFPALGRRIMLLNARRIYYPKKNKADVSPALIILAMEDVSKERLVEEKLKNYSKQLESQVLKRTEELSERIQGIEKLNMAMVGRENRMVELKKIITNIKAVSNKQTTVIKGLNKELLDLKEQISSRK